MNEEEKAAYYAEISRLNKIISVVIEQNDLQKQEIKQLKIYIGQKATELPDPKTGNGQKVEWMSDIKTKIGQIDLDMSILKMDIGQTEAGISTSKTVVGQTENRLPNAKISVGQTQELKPLPDLYPADSNSVVHLANVLKRNELKYATLTCTENAARLLIHFYNKGRSDYRELRKITKLSQGGLSKFMTSLRRKKLIENIGWQKYTPTDRALQFMQEVWRATRHG